jgi:hypothetical protein
LEYTAKAKSITVRTRELVAGIVSWKKDRIIDELFYMFRKTDVSTDPKTGHKRSKYERQGEFILYRTNLYKPPPVFIVYESDLVPGSQLDSEVSGLDDEALDDVMREAIYRLLDELNTSEFKPGVLRRNIHWEIHE